MNGIIPLTKRDLTPRQIEIIQLLADGLVRKEVVNKLDISLSTVKTHLVTSFNNTGIRTSTGLVAHCLRKGLIK